MAELKERRIEFQMTNCGETNCHAKIQKKRIAALCFFFSILQHAKQSTAFV